MSDGCLLPCLFLIAGLFVVSLAMYLAITSVIAGWMIVRLHGASLRKTIRKTPRVREGSEPAVKQYFYSAAWRELRLSFQSTHESAMVERRNAIEEAQQALTSTPAMSLFVAAWYIAVQTSTLAAYLFLGIAIALHALFLAGGLAVSAIFASVLRATELASMAVRKIYLVCPNRDCHRHIALPAYRCPACGVRHDALMPGSYGAIRRHCKCGNVLPTLFLFGRGRVPAFCPHASCGKPLNEAIGSARNVHIAVIGGPYVGKTAFLTAVMLEIQRKGTVEMRFPDRGDQMAFEAAAGRFLKGIPVDKTAGASPNAMLVRVADARQDQSLLYIYDAAGELYAGTSELRGQNFFSHTDGVALLVDPFSLRGVRIDRAREIAAIEPLIRASTELPQDVYGRLVMVLREQQGPDRIDAPLAIILTKVDAAGLERELDSLGIREWLVRHGEGNLVQSAEHDFRTVRYFACSALGRMPSATTSEAFVSRGVLEPFHWLAEANGVRLS